MSRKGRHDHTEHESARREIAERHFRLARDATWSRPEREEFRRVALRWARTLSNGPEKDRILSLDEQRGS
jgi:hypothetical protein